MNNQTLLDKLASMEKQVDVLYKNIKELTTLIQANEPSHAPLIDDDWRTVEEFPNYEVSQTGQVRKSSTHHPIKQRVSPQTGKVNIMLQGKLRSLAKIVATAFIDNPSQLSQVAYKDGNALNVTVDNLEWKSSYVARTSNKKLVATSFRDGARIEFASVSEAAGGSFTSRGIYKALKDGSIHCDCYWNWEGDAPRVETAKPQAKLTFPFYWSHKDFDGQWFDADEAYYLDYMLDSDAELTETNILHAMRTGEEINGYKFKGEL